MTREKAQPYRFRLIMNDGSEIEGGCESRELCLDHIYHCLKQSKEFTHDIESGWYLGKYAKNLNPKKIELDR